MSEGLLSVGLDVGTTSTQLVVSRLRVENRAGGFCVPELAITQRQILYQSPVHFTPLLSRSLVDGEKLRQLVEAEYRAAGLRREEVDTGAIIVTGETSRKENARRVLDALSELAGDFVVAVAGPDLESVLAAKGSGAVDYSRDTGKTVLHMDIGGGTGNLALIREGKIVSTGCLNVGGRLIRFDGNGTVTYVSPVLTGLCDIREGQQLDTARAEQVCALLTRTLEMAASLRPWEKEGEALLTREASGRIPRLSEPPVLSFSGGVAECIRQAYPDTAFGDLGPLLGKAIRQSRLCAGEYRLGDQAIRATVIGAGCHTTQLSGSTVFCRNIPFPLKNLPVAVAESPGELREALARQEGTAVAVLRGLPRLSYRQITALAEALIPQLPDPVLLCMERDMAKALGQALAVRLPEGTGILCIDRVRVSEGDYLDIAAPVGAAMPVVVKTLVLGNVDRRCI